MLCYACDDISSLQNLEEEWMGKVTDHSENPIFILVGTKSDLYDKTNKKHVSEESAEEFAEKLGIKSVFRSSSFWMKEIKESFECAAKVGLKVADKRAKCEALVSSDDAWLSTKFFCWFCCCN